MECRCYRGGEGRTRMKQLRYSRLDLIGLLVTVILLAAVIVLNLIPMPFLEWLL